MKSQPLHSIRLDQPEIRLRETRLERESEKRRLEKLRAKLQKVQLTLTACRAQRVHPAE